LKLSQPNADELGYADSVSVEEIGGTRVCSTPFVLLQKIYLYASSPIFILFFIYKVTVVKNEEGGNSVATVVLRGSTDSILDDLERAVDDGVNTYKVYL
jgi:T-complex protein 1 subunit theta